MNNRRYSLSLFAVLSSLISVTAGPAAATVSLNPITVTTPRVSELGLAVSKIDSLALRESVAMSLAEVIGFNSSLFVKNYGRATLSTVSFRGTSATHTGVTWNGMKISSPMLGTTDFSMIPSYFVDKVQLVHGSSSIADVGGGLGGLVRLSSGTDAVGDGLRAQYVQGIGSWMTFDEFLRVSYGKGRWKASTRTSFSSSRNDFPYTNYDKKENIYDDNHNIISSFHPRERNRSGAFFDFNILGSVSYDTETNGLWSLDAWYLSSNRELPLLTTDYSSDPDFDNRQRENTFRTLVKWQRSYNLHMIDVRAGYIYSDIKYDYWRKIGHDVISVMTQSRGHINTFYGSFLWKYFPTTKWYVSVNTDIHYHSVSSHDFASMSEPPPGFSRCRTEIGVAANVKWRPSSRFGAAMTLREDVFGGKMAAPVPALFLDAVIWPKIALTGRASVARNYRFPSLNDLYMIPGGNPDLKPEHGFTYDGGLSSALGLSDKLKITIGSTYFDSYIDDWIMWLPSPKGFYVPRNAKRVHSSGVQSNLGFEFKPSGDWDIDLSMNYSYTASINRSPVADDADKSYGKQLPYMPKHSGSATLRIGWRKWFLVYLVQAYSERFTMSSNETSLTGHLPAYSISNINFGRQFNLWKLDWQAKLAVNNMFNADYQTVLSRPMPGINFEIFLSLTW